MRSLIRARARAPIGTESILDELQGFDWGAVGRARILFEESCDEGHDYHDIGDLERLVAALYRKLGILEDIVKGRPTKEDLI